MTDIKVTGTSEVPVTVPPARLGILGGTFDHVHHAHLVAAHEAWHQLGLDRVLFVPAGSPPHKPGLPVSAAAHRVRMLELAIAGRPQFALSRVDLDRPGPHYSADMLHLLRAEWGPGPSFIFIVGADSLRDMLGWYQPARILEQAELAVVGRPGVEPDLRALDERLPGIARRVRSVSMPLLDISGSDLRARVRQGRPIAFLLPDVVEAYIRQERLYLG